jgi:hypothetical protein
MAALRRLVLLVASASAATSQQSAPATSPLIAWTGRAVRNEALATVSFDWQSVVARFTVAEGSTAVYATLESTFWAAPPARHHDGALMAHDRALQQSQFPKFGVFRVYVDGVRQGAPLDGVVVNRGVAEYELVSGLDAGRAHNVSLWYTTDPVFNSWPDLDLGIGCLMTVHSIRTDGALAAPPPPRSRSLLIIGDSITSGNAMFLPCDNATKCDSSQSYAGLLCEAFALNCTQLTASSKGLVHNCCDSLPANVPVLANRTFAQDNATMWDWSSTPFDGVWIHLGTNDGSSSPPAVFAAAYLQLMRNVVRESRHNIPIFAAFGPNSDRFAPWLEMAATSARAEGLNVTIVDLMAAPMDGCGHPGALGHPAMARIAAPIIANVTGWAWAQTNFSGSDDK